MTPALTGTAGYLAENRNAHFLVALDHLKTGLSLERLG